MLEIRNICLELGTFSLRDISLDLEKADYLTLLGVSGAGKTLMLEVLAGLVKPTSGKVLLNGKDITSASIQHRGIGLVYQDLCLFPHMSVAKNILYPLRNTGLNKMQQASRVRELAEETGIAHLLDRLPEKLSGGEARRAALARTLAADPEVLLLDEPLANMDSGLKSGLRSLLRSIHQKGKTIIHVTHDYMESATLSNRVAIIEQGMLIQTGRPEEVFRHPKSEFVARFSGIRNIFSCTVENDAKGKGLKKAVVQGYGPIFYIGNDEDSEGYVMISQQDIFLSAHPLETSAVNQAWGVVQEAYPAGGSMEVIINAGIDFVVQVSTNSFYKMELTPGKKVWLSFKASSARFLKN